MPFWGKVVIQLKIKSDFQMSLLLGLFAFIVAVTVDFIRGFEYVILQADGRNDYVTQANEMLQGFNYMVENPNPLGHGIGFSFLIASTFAITASESFILLKLLLALCHGASALLLSKLGQRIQLPRPAWIAATLFYSLDPFILFAVSDVTTEAITTLAVIYWAYLYLNTDLQTKLIKLHAIIFFFSSFFLVTARPNSILPFAVMSVLLTLRWRHEGVNLKTLVILFQFFLIPLIIFEYLISKIYNGFVFLSPAGGVNAEFMCSKEFVPQYIGLISQSENTRINNWWYEASKSSEILANQSSFSIPKLNSELWQIGIQKCLDEPITSLAVLALKPIALWRPYVVYGAYGPSVFLISIIVWVPLSIATLYVLFKRTSLKQMQLLKTYFIILAITFTVSLEITPTQIRHRVAIAEPFYWLFAVIVGLQTLRYFRNRKNR
jgi:hypothetical protein